MPAAPLFALSLLSAAALGYVLLLMRLFSIIQWHHFAYMMISVALLGYGAAGAMVALAQRWLAPRFAAVFVGGAILFLRSPRSRSPSASRSTPSRFCGI